MSRIIRFFYRSCVLSFRLSLLIAKKIIRLFYLSYKTRSFSRAFFKTAINRHSISSAPAYIVKSLVPPRDPQLVMCILVRNAANIIVDNILFHHKQGIDAFVIGDNGSIDGTRERIDALARKVPIEVLEFPSDEYAQSEWFMSMARVAYKKYDAWYIIATDADEFLFAENGKLKQEFPLQSPVTKMLRYNMVSPQLSDPYYLRQWRVCRTIEDVTKNADTVLHIEHFLRICYPKIALNPRGFHSITNGSHRVRHFFSSWGVGQAPGIHVLHFPWHNYRSLEDDVKKRAKLMATRQKPQMGYHQQHFVRLYNAGLLRKQYDSLMPNGEEFQVLEKFGFITKDTRLRERFKQLGLPAVIN